MFNPWRLVSEETGADEPVPVVLDQQDSDIEFLADEGITGVETKRLGVPDRFISHGTQDELRKLCGFDKDAIAQAVLQMVRRGKKRSREGWERGSA